LYALSLILFVVAHGRTYCLGEAGAINLYGRAYGLPQAISGVNSYWLRGYGDPAPQTLIVLGIGSAQAQHLLESCKRAGLSTNRYGVRNEETEDHPVILLCLGPHRPWPELCKRLRSFWIVPASQPHTPLRREHRQSLLQLIQSAPEAAPAR
jgi:hypothetical protein